MARATSSEDSSRASAPLPGLPPEARIALESRFGEFEKRFRALELRPKGLEVQTTNFAALEGQFCTVEAPVTGLTVLLPEPRPQNRNGRISFNLRNANPVSFLAVNGLVNGRSSGVMNLPGTFDAISDGQTGWFISVLAGGPTSTGSVTSAKYFLEAADAGLPNARVADDSTEIDLDYTSPGIVSWFLKTASVGFAKLANLTGLSVLGRAANSSGVMAAITATTARQVLQVDDAGTSLQWGNPIAVWSPSGADQGDYNTLDFRTQTSIIVDGGAFAGGRWQVRLLRAALTGVIAAAQDSNATTFSPGVDGNHLTLSGGNTVLDWDGFDVRKNSAGSVFTRRRLNLIEGSNVTLTVADDAVNDEVDVTLAASFATPGWDDALGVDANTNGHNPVVSVGDFLQLGAVGPTTNSPQIRSGDAAFRIAGGGALVELSGASQVRVTAAATGVSAALSYVIGGVARWTVLGNGEWSTPAGGTATSFWRWQSGAFPVWSTIALADLPSQAADTLLGRLAGAGSPAAQNLSALASTSFVYDATSHTFQLAAASGGDVARAQNSVTYTINNNAVTNAKAADMAQATIKLRAAGAGTGDPTDGTITNALDMASSTNGAMLARSAASGNIWTIVPNQANGRHLFTDGASVATWGDPTTGSGGTLSLASTGSLSVVPDNDMDITTDVGNGVGFSRNMNRCIWWDDFNSVQGLNVPAGFTYITCDTAWIATNSAGGTATVSAVDGGASGTPISPGQINIATGATTGTQIDFHKGQLNTTRAFVASDIRSIKFRLLITSAASVHITFGLNIASFGSLDCARFDFDSSVDTTIHVISANSGGVTLNNTDTNIAPGTGFREYEIRSPSKASLNWEYYIDGTLVATHTTTSKSRGVNLHLSIANLTAANKDLRIDYVSFEGWPVR